MRGKKNFTRLQLYKSTGGEIRPQANGGAAIGACAFQSTTAQAQVLGVASKICYFFYRLKLCFTLLYLRCICQKWQPYWLHSF